MKKSIVFISALCAATFFSSCTVKQDAYARRTVSASGTGSVTVVADNATVILSVITKGKDVAAASSENAEKMTAVQNSLIEAGIQKDNITTENFNIYQESYYDPKTHTTVSGDYRVTNQIKIYIKKIDMISSVIDLSLKSGANQLSSLTYGITDTELAEKQARTIAVQKAKESAALLAGASGAQLGNVLSIHERTEQIYPRNYLMKANATLGAVEEMAADAAPTPIQGGKSTVTISVDTVYQLR